MRLGGHGVFAGTFWAKLPGNVFMIGTFNSALGHLFDFILYPFRGLSPWIAMAVLSLITAVFMLLVYRLVSNQAGIRMAKKRIAAHLLELRLYKDSLPVTFKAQGSILRWNLRYILHSMKPMLIMIVPLVLAIIQLDLRFGYGPLEPGATAILKVRLNEGRLPSSVIADAGTSSGFVVETPPLRIDPEREVNWRLRAATPGIHDLKIRIGKDIVAKRIVVGTAGVSGVSPARVGSYWLDELLNPGEKPISL